ncbi:hypothetical protein Ae331Ps2_6313 [Pseudonocardia sp. Ae331_Ps2]|nr:hypothetical protein Ae331Ps2_6306 [Pseudonocardia sp. Ae331_Ps2]OLL89414.1 hypothetical protein Ae331Ps2_6313 [Pseudonocardia sp. Ae331_Ps2]
MRRQLRRDRDCRSRTIVKDRTTLDHVGRLLDTGGDSQGLGRDATCRGPTIEV